MPEMVLAMARTVGVAGRVTIEDPSVVLPRSDGSGLMIDARLSSDQLPRMASARDAMVASDRTFALTGLFGRRLFEVLNVPHGWYVKSIQYRGHDIADTPTELKASDDPSALAIVLSNRGATISGRVVDYHGEPSWNVQVVMYPVDSARWDESEPTRASVSADGAFRLGPRRPGSYFVAALEWDEAFINGADLELFTQVGKVAERITLTENEERSLDLRVVHIR